MNADLGPRWLTTEDAKKYVGRRIRTTGGRVGTVFKAVPSGNGDVILLFAGDAFDTSIVTDSEHATIVRD